MFRDQRKAQAIDAGEGPLLGSQEDRSGSPTSRGGDLDVLARELELTAAALATWRDKYHEAGQGALKSRQSDNRDDEVLRTKAMVGDLTMRNEILQEGIRIKEGRPFLTRRSRP